MNLSFRERRKRLECDRRSHRPVHKRDNRGKLLMAFTSPRVDNRRRLQELKGFDMPAIASESSEAVGSSITTLPAMRRSDCSTAKSLVSSSRRSSLRGSPGDNRSCTPALTDTPSVPHNQTQRTNSTRPLKERPLLYRLETVFVDLEGPDLRFQSRGRHTKLGCRTKGPRHSASAFSQRRLNHLFFLSHKNTR